MEDRSRDLARAAQVKSDEYTHKVPTRWRVLLIGDLGKIVSFHISKPFLLALTACLCAVLAVVTYSVVSYNSVRLENKQLRKDLDTLRVKLETSEKAKEKALVGLMALEDSVKQTARKAGPASDRETKDVAPKVTTPSPAATKTAKAKVRETPSPTATKTGKTSAPETPSPATTALQLTRAEEDKVTAPGSPANILVKNLEIWRQADSHAFKFQFTLKNVDRERRKIAGHAFVVLRPEEGSRELIRAFPWSPLKDGKPAIFKRGRYFSIISFKFIRGALTDVNSIGRFKTATVYVYSETGDLLVEEVFEVGNIFRS
jgi:hypothetical protein